MKKLINILRIFLIVYCVPVTAQNVIEVQPLFEYPVAPEEIESLNEKCNFLVNNFWNEFDFKRKEPVDQYALNEAFHVYSSTFQFASAKDVDQSIDKLLKNLSGNPLLMMQFCKAAEENLYGPRAEFWSDELYLKFIDAVIKNKKISEARKNKYLIQSSALRESAEGNVAPVFWFNNKERESKKYFPMSTPTLLIVGTPEDTDWRIARLRMESNYKLTEALEKGKVNVLYIIPSEIDNWQNSVANYNKYWTIGQSNDINTHYDIRLDPSLYLIGPDGKIINKNVPLDKMINDLLNLVN